MRLQQRRRGVAVPRLLFNLDFFLRQFHFWNGTAITVPFLEATCPFSDLSSSGTPGSNGLSYLTILYTLRRAKNKMAPNFGWSADYVMDVWWA